MNLYPEIDIGNQQQIKVQVSTPKENSQLMSASSKPKSKRCQKIHPIGFSVYI